MSGTQNIFLWMMNSFSLHLFDRRMRGMVLTQKNRKRTIKPVLKSQDVLKEGSTNPITCELEMDVLKEGSISELEMDFFILTW